MRVIETIRKGFRIDKKIWVSFFYDILFYLAFAVGIIGFAFILKSVLFNLQGINLSSFLSDDVNSINLNAKLLEILFVKMIGTIFLFLVYILFIFTLFKGLIWTKLLGSRMNRKYFFKSLVINLIEGIIFFVLFVYFAVKLKSVPLIAGLIIVFMHFNSISYYLFTKDNKIFSSILKSIKLTFSRADYLIHYVIIALIMTIFFGIIGIISKIIPKTASIILMVFGLIFMFSMFRNYFVKIMENKHDK